MAFVIDQEVVNDSDDMSLSEEECQKICPTVLPEGDESDESDVTESEKVTDICTGADNDKHLSKTEKKRKRYEQKISYRKEKRKLVKMKRKEKASSNTDDDGNPGLSKRERQNEMKAKLREAMVTGQRICVDLSLDVYMSEKECSRLAQQLCRLYGSNRIAARPAHVYFTGLNKSGFLYQECVRKNSGFENYAVEMTEKSHMDMFSLDEIVYLSPNSSNVLETIDKDKVYVIGGLVDESVQKNFTQSRAEKLDIQTMRLPITEHMDRVDSSLKTGNYNTILTINQVFEILLTFTEAGDWKLALSRGVPQRKGFVLKD